jgi:hypothetical protein
VTQRKELAFVTAVALSLVVIGFVLGRWTAPANVETVTVTKTEEKERIVWREKTETAAATTATVEKKERVRVVTRWLRPDGSTLKLQLKETGSTATSTSTASSTEVRQASGETARSSESRTSADLRPQPRFHVQALVGIDLGHGLARRYGGSVSVRAVGPIHLSAVAFPGAKLYGAGVGISF